MGKTLLTPGRLSFLSGSASECTWCSIEDRHMCCWCATGFDNITYMLFKVPVNDLEDLVPRQQDVITWNCILVIA